MSAFIVTPEHIKLLACYYSQKKFPNPADISKSIEEANRVANILYKQNIRSVQERYSDLSFDKLPGPIQKPKKIEITPFDYHRYAYYNNHLQIVAFVRCLEYQSCETKDWRKTQAYHLCNDIKDIAISNLSEYDNLDWEFVDKEARENTQEMKYKSRNRKGKRV